MIFWEHQSREVGGGRNRLTIWADGRSEVTVVPDASFRQSQRKLQPRKGWIMKEGRRGLYFVHPDVFPKEVAKDKFQKAFAAGIHHLKTFKAQYVDGSGTLVGVQIGSRLQETVIPIFDDAQEGTRNHKRFLAVSEVLSDFETRAFDIPN